MSLTKQQKEELIHANQIHPTDTGSSEVQIGVLTQRINDLTEHLKEHNHDFSTRRGLIKMVGRRRRLLRYLKKKQPQRYSALIERLGLKDKQ